MSKISKISKIDEVVKQFKTLETNDPTFYPTIGEAIKGRLARINCEARLDAAGVYQVYWHGKQTEFVYTDIIDLHGNLDEIIITIEARTSHKNIDLFWQAIERNIAAIKALPNDILISIVDGINEQYSHVNANDIYCDHKAVWVTLTKRHMLVLFKKSDYMVLNTYPNNNGAAIAKSEIENTFQFSKAIDYSDILEGEKNGI